MQPDVADLRQFYDSRLGHIVRRTVRQRLRTIWPDTRGLRVLGVGYASPYLLGFREGSERVLTFMTARQGAHRWPPGEAGLAALVEDAELPLPEASMDRVLLVHALEHTEHTQIILREVWRVMAPEGRLLLVVPNRRGLWARLERTPFGTGHPYSPPQLANLLRSSMFVPVETQAALYFPPSRRRMVLRAAGAMERLGTRFGRVSFGGALIVEATKQVYAVSNQGAYSESVRRRRARAALPLGTSGRAHSGSCAAYALEPSSKIRGTGLRPPTEASPASAGEGGSTSSGRGPLPVMPSC
jgi:SAM-dependent methyltransferase